MANNKVELANGTVLVDLTADTVVADKLVIGYTAHDASGASITGTCINVPLIPIAYDYEPGYTNQGTFIYQNSTNNHSDIYEVTGGHNYAISLGSTVGSRFRAAVLPTNPVGAGADVAGTQVVNLNNPSVHAFASFKVTDDGYFVVTKDNVSKKNLKSYLYDITPVE